MFDPYFNAEVLDFSKLARGNQHRLSGLLWLEMHDTVLAVVVVAHPTPVWKG